MGTLSMPRDNSLSDSACLFSRLDVATLPVSRIFSISTPLHAEKWIFVPFKNNHILFIIFSFVLKYHAFCRMNISNTVMFRQFGRKRKCTSAHAASSQTRKAPRKGGAASLRILSFFAVFCTPNSTEIHPRELPWRPQGGGSIKLIILFNPT